MITHLSKKEQKIVKEMASMIEQVMEEYKEKGYDKYNYYARIYMLNELIKERYGEIWKTEIIECELAHNTAVFSKYWYKSHKILKVVIHETGRVFYLDPNSYELYDYIRYHSLRQGSYTYYSDYPYFIGWDEKPSYLLFAEDNYLYKLEKKCELLYGIAFLFEYEVKGRIYDLLSLFA